MSKRRGISRAKLKRCSIGRVSNKGKNSLTRWRKCSIRLCLSRMLTGRFKTREIGKICTVRLTMIWIGRPPTMRIRSLNKIWNSTLFKNSKPHNTRALKRFSPAVTWTNSISKAKLNILEVTKSRSSLTWGLTKSINIKISCSSKKEKNLRNKKTTNNSWTSRFNTISFTSRLSRIWYRLMSTGIESHLLQSSIWCRGFIISPLWDRPQWRETLRLELCTRGMHCFYSRDQQQELWAQKWTSKKYFCLRWIEVSNLCLNLFRTRPEGIRRGTGPQMRRMRWITIYPLKMFKLTIRWELWICQWTISHQAN